MLKIAVERGIVYGYEVFSTIGEVYLYDGSSPSDPWRLPKDTDILVVRSNVRVNRAFLQPFVNLKIIVSPTIGIDHIDENALIEHQKRLSRRIPVINAPGSTSSGVGDYVAAALIELKHDGIIPSKCCVGIWGYGNCGRQVKYRAQALGCDTVEYDPPLQERTHGEWVSAKLSDVLDCDVITLHVPLTIGRQNRWPTYKMIDAAIMESLKGKVLINTSRGPVVDNAALVNFMKKAKLIGILDVYDNEPDVSPGLIENAYISTPHIAGSIRQGKLRAIKHVYEQLCNLLQLKPRYNFHSAFLKIMSPYRIRNQRLSRVDMEIVKRAVNLMNTSEGFKEEYLDSELPGLVFLSYRAKSLRDEIIWPWDSPA